MTSIIKIDPYNTKAISKTIFPSTYYSFNPKNKVPKLKRLREPKNIQIRTNLIGLSKISPKVTAPFPISYVVFNIIAT